MPQERYYQCCIRCGKEYPSRYIIYSCDCGGLLEIRYRLPARPDFRGNGIWRYAQLLPCNSAPVSLGEGGTPVYSCDKLARELGLKQLWVKYEGANPTGSFKDRGMSVGLTKAIELGMSKLICASTGNTAASLAVYAAKAGLSAYIILPSAGVALGKVSQAMLFGAQAYRISGNFDAALNLVRELALDPKHGLYLLNSLNPYRLEGQKTLGFELFEQIGVPDCVIVPVGNAGNISAIYKGFLELKQLGFTSEIPRMIGIQAQNAAPIAKAIKSGAEQITPVRNPRTIATAIRIGNPVNAQKALSAIRESGGSCETVTDEQIIQAQLKLARLEGIGVEPASAASIAGLSKLLELGQIDPSEKIVCVATGHMLKDPQQVLRAVGKPSLISSEQLRSKLGCS